MYNILVVDDSALVRKIVCDIIGTIQNFTAKDTCGDGESAWRYLSREHYDAVVLALMMPKVSGMDLMERMKKAGNRTPVIAISVGDESLAAKAFEYGAKDFIVRPLRLSPTERPVFSRKLTLSLHFAVGDGQVKVRTYRDPNAPRTVATVRPTFRTGTGAGRMSARTTIQSHSTHNTTASTHTPVRAPASTYRGKYSLIAIASSTGGPQALHTLLPMLPGNIGVPVVIVQHMPKGFTASLAERIDAKANLTVKEAEDGEILKKNWAYIAPGGRHLQIVNKSGQLACKVYDDVPVNNLRPCADVMYESLKSVNCDHIICTVLTGMGADGSQGIASLRQVKDLYVITQSEDTCVVYG
ncbi:MAG: response regulator, partial [Lachnospiraceae bacterium]|nr:response regulator [Lachnospiraceae bacterium]